MPEKPLLTESFMSDSIIDFISEEPPESDVVYEAITPDAKGVIRCEDKSGLPPNSEGIFRAEILGRFEPGFGEEKIRTAARTRTSIRYSMLMAALCTIIPMGLFAYVAGAYASDYFPQIVGPLLPLFLATLVFYKAYREMVDLRRLYTARAVTRVTPIRSGGE